MLKQLRQKKVMKKVLWGLAIIIIPAFVLWGAGGLRESRNYAGVVFEKKITFDEYRASFNAVKNYALITYGQRFNQVRDKLNLEEQAWSRLIMLREAESKKIKISDAEVIARIAAFSFFQRKDGSFDQKAYDMILNNAFRTNPRAFEEEMRQSLMIEKLMQEVFEGVLKPTDDEIEEAMEKEAAESEGTPQERHERARGKLLATRRMEAYQKWHVDLMERANPISNLEREEPEEDVEEKTGEETKQE